jgi:UDP-N-acetylglucosamine--N-acetylmuramyl-(pentapeptide) pyrophosphoryl-undecaprenol N-acetylglucosamine transferase
MEAAYAASDLALCRGGASTVAELTVVGLPSIVVPYPHHRDRQQERHARVLQQAGAAAVLLDSEVTARRVASLASEILLDDHRLDAMRRSGRTLGRPDAAARVASVLREVAA